MSVAQVGTQGSEARRQFTRRISVFAPITLAVYAVLQVLSSTTHSDPEVRDLLLNDLTAQVILGLAAAGVAIFVGRWAARREPGTQVRGVVGLAVGAVVLGPLVWWSAAPVLLATGAIVLGQVTRMTEREGGSSAARILTLLAGLVASASFTVIVVGIVIRAF